MERLGTSCRTHICQSHLESQLFSKAIYLLSVDLSHISRKYHHITNYHHEPGWSTVGGVAGVGRVRDFCCRLDSQLGPRTTTVPSKPSGLF